MSKFDKETFLKEHGVITDKKEAINLLCQTNRAWGVIDSTLKKDPEVIMFYQPTGVEVTLRSEDIGVMLTTVTTWAETEFCWSRKGTYTYCLIPIIYFPEGFNFETYASIQQEMSANSRKAVAGEPIQCGSFRTVVNEYTDDWSHNEEDEKGLYLYDREILKKRASALLSSKQR